MRTLSLLRPTKKTRAGKLERGSGTGSKPAEPIMASSALVLVRRRWLVIAGVPLLAAVITYLVSNSLQERYTAQTSVLFGVPQAGVPALASETAAREAIVNLELLSSEALRERVAKRLKRASGVDAASRLDRSYSVEVEPGEEQSSIATIFVTDTGARRAALIANVYAREFVNYRAEFARSDLESRQRNLLQALAELPAVSRDGFEGDALRQRVESLKIAELNATGIRRLDRAVPPTEASAPKPVRNTLIGAVVGLALGLALAIGLERRDRRVRDPRFMEHILGGPIIGRIPRSRSLARSGPGTGLLPAPEAEAFRTLRANLHRQFHGQGVRSVLVTSAIPREGKTTLAWNLARIEARAGSRVLLVEADLRRPVLARRLEANGAEGLRELLAGDAQLQDLIQTIDIAGETNGATDGGGTLDVLFAGSPP